jgi:anti-sigma B factor antagonist
MSLTYTEDSLPNGVRHIKLAGMLDSDVAMNEGDEVRHYITGQGGTVLLELTDLEYLSSAGVRVVIRSAKDLDEAGGTLHIAAPQPRVMAVLTIAGFVPTFPLHKTVEEALAALGS